MTTTTKSLFPDAQSIRSFPIVVDAENFPAPVRFRHNIASALHFEWFEISTASYVRDKRVTVHHQSLTVAGPGSLRKSQSAAVSVDELDDGKVTISRVNKERDAYHFSGQPIDPFLSMASKVQFGMVYNGMPYTSGWLMYTPVDTPVLITLNDTDLKRINEQDRGTLRTLSQQGGNLYSDLYTASDSSMFSIASGAAGKSAILSTESVAFAMLRTARDHAEYIHASGTFATKIKTSEVTKYLTKKV